MVSKACIVGQYQSKLEALARHRDLELTVVVPPFWRDERGMLPLERRYTRGYEFRIEPVFFNGHFHLHFYPTLPAIIQRLRPDIVHIDEEPYNLATFLALRAARRVGAKSLFFTWQNLLRRYPPPFLWMERYVLSHSAYVIAGSREAAGVLQAKQYNGPVCIIPQFGLDPRQFIGGRIERATGSPFRIGFIGRLVEEKGPHVLLQAASKLQGDWRVELLGSGPLRARLQKQARQLGIADRVQFHAWGPSAEMPDYYRRLDLLVVPSLTRPNWKEQFGRVLIEAMACQVPVIGSNSGEIPNVIGDAGLVFPENDVRALTELIDALLRDPARRAVLGQRGRRRVLDHYTQDQVAEDTYAVYAEMARA